LIQPLEEDLREEFIFPFLKKKLDMECLKEVLKIIKIL
jgi:hypothetical protein